MNHYFLDSSALVKAYALEPGTHRVQDVIRSATLPRPSARVVVCDLAIPESAAALRQKLRGNWITRKPYALALDKLTADFGATRCPFVVVPASGVMREAASLAGKHDIRGADAVHLAAAVEARSGWPAEVGWVFWSADRQQCRAATTEGFEVYRPDTGEVLRPAEAEPDPR